MDSRRLCFLCLMCLTALLILPGVCTGNHDRIRLDDISTLTLYHGKYTQGRRSSPVPQLKCVGGTAGCSAYVPKVVQCYNRGSDGTDIQWECKMDMDNAYRFGEIAVTCEGYDYPEDKYVLTGSCGLEYELDLTKEGYQQQQQGGHQYYGSNQDTRQQQYGTQKENGFSPYGVLMLLCVFVVIYIVYQTCLAPTPGVAANPAAPPPYSSLNTGGQVPPYPTNSAAPPPSGLYPDLGSGTNYGASYDSPPPYNPSYATHGSSYVPPPFVPPQPKTYSTRTNTNDGPGFWSGAATGGVLGYLFGSRNSQQHAPPPAGGSSWGWGNTGSSRWGSSGSSSGWGGSSSGWGGGASSSGSTSTSSGSTGTRTASGFGGTRRR